MNISTFSIYGCRSTILTSVSMYIVPLMVPVLLVVLVVLVVEVPSVMRSPKVLSLWGSLRGLGGKGSGRGVAGPPLLRGHASSRLRGVLLVGVGILRGVVVLLLGEVARLGGRGVGPLLIGGCRRWGVAPLLLVLIGWGWESPGGRGVRLKI